jgi:hypothetical protein
MMSMGMSMGGGHGQMRMPSPEMLKKLKENPELIPPEHRERFKKMMEKYGSE